MIYSNRPAALPSNLLAAERDPRHNGRVPVYPVQGPWCGGNVSAVPHADGKRWINVSPGYGMLEVFKAQYVGIHSGGPDTYLDRPCCAKAASQISVLEEAVQGCEPPPLPVLVHGTLNTPVRLPDLELVQRTASLGTTKRTVLDGDYIYDVYTPAVMWGDRGEITRDVLDAEWDHVEQYRDEPDYEVRRVLPSEVLWRAGRDPIADRPAAVQRAAEINQARADAERARLMPLVQHAVVKVRR